MNEARRFLRYLIPGFSVFFELILYILITSPKDFIMDNVDNIWSMRSGLPVLLAFISIGVGYFCANLFHNLYWLAHWLAHRLSFPIRLLEDHLLYLRQALPSDNATHTKMLKIVNSENDREIKLSQLTQLDAWNITTAFWHERTESSKIIKGANSRIDNLTDLKHGFGASIVGSFLAVILWAVATYFYKEYDKAYTLPMIKFFFIMLPVAIFFFGSKVFSYSRVITNLEKMVSTIILDQLLEEYTDNDNEVITIHYFLPS